MAEPGGRRGHRAVRTQRLPGEPQQVGGTGVAHDVVGDRHDQEQLRQAERGSEGMAVSTGLDAGQGREA